MDSHAVFASEMMVPGANGWIFITGLEKRFEIEFQRKGN